MTSQENKQNHDEQAAPREQKQLPVHLQKLLNKHNTADSAGVPWEGRELNELNFQHDAGHRDVKYAEVREAFSAGAATEQDVFRTLAQARILIPIQAYHGDVAEGVNGLVADRSADMAMIFIQAPDGRKTLPVFTDIDMMKKWNPKARPVPVAAPRAVLSGVSEGAEVVAIDPGEHDMWLLRRPAVWAMAQGKEWIPASENPEVQSLLESSISQLPDVRAISYAPAATIEDLREGKVGVVELRVTVQLRPGMTQQQLQYTLAELQNNWAQNQRLTELVDSLEMKVVPAVF